MTDLELTKLCAEALRLRVVKGGGTLVTPHWRIQHFAGGQEVGEWMDRWKDGDVYDPLHDDAQAMALEDWLIERGDLSYINLKGGVQDMTWRSREHSFHKMFNNREARKRAIVECVAKMQLATHVGSNSETGIANNG